MTVGVTTVTAISHGWGYRLGGVMTVPLVAIYTFRELFSPLVFVVGVLVAWTALWVTREYTLNHGRRVFLIAVLAGAGGTVGFAYLVAVHTAIGFQFANAEVVASIFPGVAAYNLMRIDQEDRLVDIFASVGLFVALVAIGMAGLIVFDGRHLIAPPVLDLPTSDIVNWLGIDPQGESLTRITPNWLAIALLVGDISIYEGVRKRYDLRLLGIIILPLLAVFSIRFEATIAVFAIGAAIIFVLVTIVHWLTLLYGRVLLGISLVLGSCYALGAGVFAPAGLPGLALFFIGLFAGTAGYNLHYVSPPSRAGTLRISAALFVVFYALLFLVVESPQRGVFQGPGLGYALLGTLSIGLGVLEVYRLEQSRPEQSAFARASVFAGVDADGSAAVDSPLVSGAGNAESAQESTSGLAFSSSTDQDTETPSREVNRDE